MSFSFERVIPSFTFSPSAKKTEGVSEESIYGERFGDYSEGRCVGRDFGTTTSRTPTGLGMVPIMQRRLRCTVRPPVPSRMVDRDEPGRTWRTAAYRFAFTTSGSNATRRDAPYASIFSASRIPASVST